MKVCTDACILGAYAAVNEAKAVLDIGTGTGLLALMAAQRSQAKFDAVEVNPEAYQQAVQNVAASPFAKRIQLFDQSIQAFSLEQNRLYDVIISNPPFFQNHLLSPQPDRNTALHTESLSFEELLQSVDRLLSSEGEFQVLLPIYEAGILTQKAKAFGLFPLRQLSIRHSAQHSVFRIILTFSRSPALIKEEELTIFQVDNQYSRAFQLLLQEYYLIF